MQKFTSVVFILAALVALASSVSLKNDLRTAKVITQGGEDPDPEMQERRLFVQGMMLDAWNDYVRYAWGENELKPVSQIGQDGGIFGDSKVGATIVDSLSTLYIMNMTFEYNVARQYVLNELNFNQDADVSVFETIIRFVGGLLSAYALTSDTLYRDRAHEIAQLLLPAFDTPSGVPYSGVNILTGVKNGAINAIAGFGTLHLEFMYLSEITGDLIFRDKALHIRRLMKEIEKPNGLYPSWFDANTGEFTENYVTIGGLADSFYEYLLKSAIQLEDDEARVMYDEAMNAFIDNGLVKVSKPSNLLYFAESTNGVIKDAVGHLACFAGGMFVLGAYSDPNNPNAERDLEIGTNFTNTCHESYIRTQTRIGPEVFCFSEGIEATRCADEQNFHYLLRPETIESYFYLWRITGDRKYRDWAWDAAQSIQRYGKAGPGRGYSGLQNTNVENPQQDDVQQTYFLAETLKYLYLIFSSNELISLDQWVFNTEAHPLPIKSTNLLY